jgi:hypothetical protein
VVFDAWYSEMQLLKQIEGYGKIYYCTIKGNHNETPHYHRVDELLWSSTEDRSGKLVHLHKLPKGHTVKLFRLVLSQQRTDYLITNEVTQRSTQAAQEAFRPRWFFSLKIRKH